MAKSGIYELEVTFHEFGVYSNTDRRHVHGCYQNPQDLCRIISKLTTSGCEVLSVESRLCEYTKAQGIERSLAWYTLANHLHGGSFMGGISVTYESVIEVIQSMIYYGEAHYASQAS